jgi:protein-L-isoaspartate(D-aspartate) O-methyltransferase
MDGTQTIDDSIHHRQLRQNLVDSIRSKGVFDAHVLEAIGKVPRHLFIAEGTPLSDAYVDRPLEIGVGQTISQPFTVAYQSSLLGVKNSEKVLEIGTGSGYQAAVLFELGAQVYTIERQELLYRETKRKLTYLGYSSIHVFYGDGNEGLPDHAPFDKILVTAAAHEIPEKLIDQLKPGGVMVLPLDGDTQRMVRIRKISDDKFEREDFDEFRFVPLLGGVNPK